MRALITRPVEDAEPLARELAARGIESVIEPLLTIEPLEVDGIDLEGVQALLFTSANGVRAFARLSDRRDLPAFTVGDGSARQAHELKFGQVKSAAGDVNALAALVAGRLKPEDGALFHAAGKETAGDLKGSLEQAGFTVRRVQLYETHPATSFSPETRVNLTLGGIDLVLLFSPRTARIFADLWREAGTAEMPPGGLAKVDCLCLSEAVAREVGELPWRRIEVADRPDLPAMLDLVDAARERVANMADETTARDNAIDVAAESPQEVKPEPQSAGHRSTETARSSGFGTIAASVILSVLAAGAVTATAPQWRSALGLSGGGATTNNSEMEARISDLAAQVDAKANADSIDTALSPLREAIDQTREDLIALQTELESVRATAGSDATTSTGQSFDPEPLEDRIAALETSLAEATKRLSETSQTQANVDAATLRALLEAENRNLKDQVAALSQDVQQVAGVAPRLSEIENKLSALPEATNQQRAVALIVAIGQLRSALADDHPFDAELFALRDIAASDEEMKARIAPLIAELSPYAEAGVPTKSQLAAGFPGTEIARAGEAALAAEIGDNAGWWSGLTHRLSQVVTVRPVGADVEGDGPLERVARAEAHLQEGDLGAAVAEIKGLQGRAAEEAAEWLAQANARMAIDAAASTLSEISARELAPISTPVEQ